MDEKSAHFSRGGPADQGAAGAATPAVARLPVPYRLLDHTADLGFALEAASLEALFAGAALAIHDISADAGAARPLRERRLDVEGADLEDLLVRFLEEAHFALEGEGLLFAEVAVERVEPPAGEGAPARARGAGRGERFDRARHEIRRPLKAVTYHGIEVAPVPGGGWRAAVILDL